MSLTALKTRKNRRKEEMHTKNNQGARWWTDVSQKITTNPTSGNELLIAPEQNNN